MVGMSDTFNSTDSIECRDCGRGMLKTGFQGSGPLMKKPKLQTPAPLSTENSEAAESQDRFDDLPDSVVLHILSLMETKDAIRTCVLSKQWRCLWTSVPCLNFNSKSFPRLVEFKRFVLWVLSHRDSSCVKVLIYYRFGVDYATDQYLLDKVIEYAALHGVEEIRINLRAKTSGSPPVKLPMSLFNCKSLKRLELKGCHPTNVSSPHGCRSVEMPHSEQLSMHPAIADYANSIASLPELFGFTTLTTLHLNSLTLCYTGNEVLDPFVNCVNLKDLHLSEMSFKSQLIPRDFVISAPQLNNLTLMCNRFKCKLVVNAPQLINFSYLYSTPRAFFEFSIPSLDGVIIDIYELQDRWGNSLQNIVKTSHGLINMVRGHHDIGLSFRTIEDTCVNAAVLNQERSSLSKLKSLNLGVGLTYKIFINNLEHITAYFRRCSQHAADFEIVTV